VTEDWTKIVDGAGGCKSFACKPVSRICLQGLITSRESVLRSASDILPKSKLDQEDNVCLAADGKMVHWNTACA
jgi:hypothetical protein